MKCNSKNFINRLKKEKEDALEFIIEEYSSLVKGISYKILSNISKEAIDECVNDVFLTVWKMQIYLKEILKISESGLQ